MAFVKGATNIRTSPPAGAFTLVTTLTPAAAGNQLIALIGLQNATATIVSTALSSVTDNAAGGSTTYVGPTGNFGTALDVSNNRYGQWVLYCQSVKAGVTSVTANFSTGTQAEAYALMLVVEYTGLGVFDVLGAMNLQTTPGVTTDAATSGAATVTGGDTIIGVTLNWSSTGMTAGTGFTQDYVDATPANTAASYMAESLIQGAGGSRAATYTASQANNTFATAMLAFKSLTGPCAHNLLTLGVGCSIGWRAALAGAGAWRAAKAVERNSIVTRRRLMFPRAL